jgi:hypothetical protein
MLDRARSEGDNLGSRRIMERRLRRHVGCSISHSFPAYSRWHGGSSTTASRSESSGRTTIKSRQAALTLADLVIACTMPSKLPVVGKPAVPRESARHERPSKPAFSNLAEWSATAAASVSRAFTELLSAFNRKLGEISGDRVCIYLVNPGDRPNVHRVRPAGSRAKRVDHEGCR